MSLENYDPNTAADPNAGIYGLPCSFEEASMVYLPVPWEATTSYGGGTVHGPQAILDASPQMDVFDLDVTNPYQKGLYCMPLNASIQEMNDQAKKTAQTIKDNFGQANTDTLKKNLAQTNEYSKKLNQYVKKEISTILDHEKIPAIIGGDHSVPFGAFQAAAEKFGSFGILHFDAHSDTRKAFMGFEYSHASIMHNAATQIPQISKFVQVGIRDFCDEEFEFTRAQGNRFEVFYDQRISNHRFSGKSFDELASQIIQNLPEKVWVSFDIDGLDPRFCPHTGTPVPGGLDYAEAIHILRRLAKSGRAIIGFDVVEVAPVLDENGTPIPIHQASDEWDANVGMRLIYKLTALTLASQKKATWQTEL